LQSNISPERATRFAAFLDVQILVDDFTSQMALVLKTNFSLILLGKFDAL
jgi:hypothetical protein